MQQPPKFGAVDGSLIWSSVNGVSAAVAHTATFPSSDFVPTTSSTQLLPGQYLPALRLDPSFFPLTSIATGNDDRARVTSLTSPPNTVDAIEAGRSFSLKTIQMTANSLIAEKSRVSPRVGAPAGSPAEVHYDQVFQKQPPASETTVAVSVLSPTQQVHLEASHKGRNYNLGATWTSDCIVGSGKVEILRQGKTMHQLKSLIGVDTSVPPMKRAVDEFIHNLPQPAITAILPESAVNPNLLPRTLLGQIKEDEISGNLHAQMTVGMEVLYSPQFTMFSYNADFMSASRRTRLSCNLGPIAGMFSSYAYMDVGGGWAVGMQTSRVPAMKAFFGSQKPITSHAYLISKSFFRQNGTSHGSAIAPELVIGGGLHSTRDVTAQIVYQYSPTVKLSTYCTAIGALNNKTKTNFEFQTIIGYNN